MIKKYAVGVENHKRGIGGIDLKGALFERLTVIEEAGRINRSIAWLCRCECGNEIIVSSSGLRRGSTRSCGCLGRDVSSFTHTIHGHARHGRVSSEYMVWHKMLHRCFNKNSKAYKDYGGRGITVCDHWLTFDNFYKDMGPKSQGLSLDRIDNDGPYSPENCRWATNAEQHRNRRDNVFIAYKGKTQCVRDWSRELGIPYNTIRNRMLRGNPAEEWLKVMK